MLNSIQSTKTDVLVSLVQPYFTPEIEEICL